MSSRTVTIGSSVGLHARPASLLATAVADCRVDVTIARPGARGVDTSSILLIMSSGVGQGEPVVLNQGPAENRAQLSPRQRRRTAEVDT